MAVPCMQGLLLESRPAQLHDQQCLPALPGPTLHQVFYLIVMAVFGSLKGIVQLNLGSISTFQASAPLGACYACPAASWLPSSSRSSVPLASGHASLLAPQWLFCLSAL